MTIKNPLIASATFHVALFLALYLFITPNRSTFRPVPTATWMIDLTTQLRSGATDSNGARGSNAEEATDNAGRVAEGTDRLTSAEAPKVEKLQEMSTPLIGTPQPPQSDKGAPSDAEENKSASSLKATKPDGSGQAAMISRVFVNTIDMQTVMMKIRQYLKCTELSLKGMLELSPKFADRQKLEGCSGSVKVTYGSGASVQSLSVRADNDEFGSLLRDSVQWDKVPAPHDYMLPYTTVTYVVRIRKGRIDVGVAPG